MLLIVVRPADPGARAGPVDVDPGFEPAGVMTLRTTLPMPKYQPVAARAAYCASVLDEVRALPGVTSAAYTSFLPIVMGGGIWRIEAEGHPARPEEGPDGQRALRDARLLRDARDPDPAGAGREPRPTPRPACRWPW